MVENFPRWIGKLLVGRRAGRDKTLYMNPALAQVPASLVLSSSAVGGDGRLNRVHSGDGSKTSPPLAWSNVPPEAVCLALVVEDADSPTPSPFVHLLACGLPARDGSLPEGAFNAKRDAPDVHLGFNGLYGRGYTPPDPPPGHGDHHYLFQLYALSSVPVLSRLTGRRQLAAVIRNTAIARGLLEAVYSRG